MSSREQGGLGHAARVPVVVCPPQQRPRFLSPERRTHNRPVVTCVSFLCILFWLAVCVTGIAVLVVFFVYLPKSPHLRIADATFNAGYAIRGDPSMDVALNADLKVLAAIYSNNSRIDLGLQYMELDFSFKGHMMGTQVVLPAPVREPPGGILLRYVHFVAGEVELPREDVEEWKNATVEGRPVVVKLSGRIHTKLYIGPWLRLTYWVYPHCILWVKPAPPGTLLKTLCYV